MNREEGGWGRGEGKEGGMKKGLHGKYGREETERMKGGRNGGLKKEGKEGSKWEGMEGK
jgi:hypothetical protein